MVQQALPWERCCLMDAVPTAAPLLRASSLLGASAKCSRSLPPGQKDKSSLQGSAELRTTSVLLAAPVPCRQARWAGLDRRGHPCCGKCAGLVRLRPKKGHASAVQTQSMPCVSMRLLPVFACLRAQIGSPACLTGL